MKGSADGTREKACQVSNPARAQRISLMRVAQRYAPDIRIQLERNVVAPIQVTLCIIMT